MNNKKIVFIFSIIVAIFIIAIVAFLYYGKKPITYSVTFETNGGSLVSEQTVHEKGKVIKPEDPTKNGYEFVEWIYQGKVYDFDLEVKEDIQLEAKWKKIEVHKETYTVKFNSDSTIVENQIVEKGHKIVKPIDPVKEGYTFKGWILSNGEIYDFEAVAEKDIELKAKWEKIEETSQDKVPSKKYTVTFNANGGSSVNSQTITEGKKATRPNNPTRTGYTFVGWLLNGNIYDFNKSVNKNITLIAKWEKIEETSQDKVPSKKYTVTFNANGGSSVNSQTITEGKKATRPNNPTRTGYTFVGWLLNGNIYDFNKSVNKNITLIAKWEKIEETSQDKVPSKKYTVTFNANGGSSVNSQTITEGKKATRPNNPTRTGYTFAGWLLNGKTYDFNNPVNKNITLIAKWNEKIYTVKVSSVDQYSPDRILTVYEDGKKINVSSIKYNGTTLCSGSNMVVNMYEIEGINTVTIILTNGTSVTASVQ